ncbi:ATP-dependent DNA helicase [Trichonephila clavata]|uniref:ATP-dependent DNA helicase n=1 Tax=Trichonephila clavata TaxID=2740835 RepID=A0A8X6GID7_TRICU|nr:ATP-dependent DNA helicase [Trichonephila clavata]
MFRNHNCLVRDCKSAIDDVRSDYFRADEAPSNEHERRFNGSRISSGADDIGQRVILPASYTGSPRDMQEYAQDALTYVRKYGLQTFLSPLHLKKIVPTQIDDIIRVELPDPEEGPGLVEIVKKNMIHEPRRLHNPHSPCMKDRKYTKKYPRQLLKETQTSGEGYPLYRRRDSVDGGHTTVKLINVDIKIDNQ